MATATTGVSMGFKDTNGKTWTKSISGLDASVLNTATKAKEFATAYKGIVDGDLTSVKYIRTEPVDVD